MSRAGAARRRGAARALPLLAALVLLAGVPARAQESERQDAPAPDKAEDLSGPYDRGFDAEPRQLPLFPWVRTRLRNLPPFFRDTHIDLHLRNFYWYRDLVDDSKHESWAMGGRLAVRSGWLAKRIQIGGELFTSFKLRGPVDRDGSLLLRPGQKSFHVIGRSFARVRLAEGHQAHIYRDYVDLPYINKHDSRMVPNTFEGYWVEGDTSAFDYTAGYFTKIKPRNSDRFVPMSEIAGVDDAKRGVAHAGFLYHPNDTWSAGVLNLFGVDLYNTLYAELNYLWEVTEAFQLRFGAQFTDQRSVGQELLTSFDTRVFSGRVAASYAGAILAVAFSSTANEDGIRSPWGSYPGYLALMLSDFNLAGEDAFLVGLSYDFKNVGINGLSAFANYARGHNVRATRLTPQLPGFRNNREEIDLTVDYRIKRGPLRGLWFRLRGAYLHERGSGGGDDVNVRAIIFYDLPLL